MDERLKANLAMWNQLAQNHPGSPMYRLDEFRRGDIKLSPLELREVGDVRGKSLLHLQCHFGMDTLSWARLGARVTGVDFSDQAIAIARKLATELGLDANFVCCPLFDAPKHVCEKFDIVFTSYGVLCWLPDINEWARTIAHFLKPDGFFYIAEIHPIANIFQSEPGAKEIQIEYSYFRDGSLEFPPDVDYADHSKFVPHVSHEWLHKFSDIVNALQAAGLRIDFIHEFPYCGWQLFPFSRQEADGNWYIPGNPFPQLFSLKASKA